LEKLKVCGIKKTPETRLLTTHSEFSIYSKNLCPKEERIMFINNNIIEKL
jgi:hypothetical protein